MASRCIAEAELRGLLKVLAHDMRNPLAAVVTNLEFARRVVAQSGDPDLVESIVDSQTACEVLRQLIANLEVLALPAPPAPGDVALGPICHEVLTRCAARVRQAGLTLALEGDESRARAQVDRGLITLALENLLCNAIQHAPRGSTVTVRLVDRGEPLVLEVGDSGGAIPCDARDKAMSPAGQLKEGRVNGSRYSRGAGLLIARIAAEASGAELVIAGDDGASTMTLRLPRRFTSG